MSISLFVYFGKITKYLIIYGIVFQKTCFYACFFIFNYNYFILLQHYSVVRRGDKKWGLPNGNPQSLNYGIIVLFFKIPNVMVLREFCRSLVSFL